MDVKFFNKHSTTVDGFSCFCRSCEILKKRSNKTQRYASAAKYRKKNKKIIATKRKEKKYAQREYMKKYHKTPMGKKRKRLGHIREKYRRKYNGEEDKVINEMIYGDGEYKRLIVEVAELKAQRENRNLLQKDMDKP